MADNGNNYESQWKLFIHPLRILFTHEVGEHVVEVEQTHTGLVSWCLGNPKLKTNTGWMAADSLEDAFRVLSPIIEGIKKTTTPKS